MASIVQQTVNALTDYKDFEPQVEWVKADDADAAHVIVPGFKREQLRVQVTSSGNLRVSGQRPLEGKKVSRFVKELKIPTECDINGITAKFEGDILQIRLPKKIGSALSPPKAEKHPLAETQLPEKHREDDKPASGKEAKSHQPEASDTEAHQPDADHTKTHEKHAPEARHKPHAKHGSGGRHGPGMENRKRSMAIVLVVVGALVVGYFSGRLHQAVTDGWNIVQNRN